MATISVLWPSVASEFKPEEWASRFYFIEQLGRLWLARLGWSFVSWINNSNRKISIHDPHCDSDNKETRWKHKDRGSKQTGRLLIRRMSAFVPNLFSILKLTPVFELSFKFAFYHLHDLIWK